VEVAPACFVLQFQSKQSIHLARQAKPSSFTSCTNSSCDVDLLRRNLVTTALHGAGIYQFDLIASGWFGRPGAGLNATSTAAIWQAIASGRKAVEDIFKAGEAQPADGVSAAAAV
jgi:hypothetical protein